MVQTDPEASMLAVVDKVKQARPIPTRSRQAPRRSHQSMGGVSRYHRLLQEQVRVMRAELERRIEARLDVRLLVVAWLIRHASWSLLRFHVERGPRLCQD